MPRGRLVNGGTVNPPEAASNPSLRSHQQIIRIARGTFGLTGFRIPRAIGLTLTLFEPVPLSTGTRTGTNSQGYKLRVEGYKRQPSHQQPVGCLSRPGGAPPGACHTRWGTLQGPVMRDARTKDQRKVHCPFD